MCSRAVTISPAPPSSATRKRPLELRSTIVPYRRTRVPAGQAFASVGQSDGGAGSSAALDVSSTSVIEWILDPISLAWRVTAVAKFSA
jgi:hypothetical protein